MQSSFFVRMQTYLKQLLIFCPIMANGCGIQAIPSF